MSYFPNANLQPLRLAIKFNPPVIALIYKNNPKDKKKRRYNIFLNQLAFLPNPEQITDLLFQEHSGFLNEQNVDYQQVFRMVQMIVKNFKYIESPMGSPGETNDYNQYTPVDQLVEVDSYIDSDNEDINKSIVFQNEEQTYFSTYDSNRLKRSPTEIHNDYSSSKMKYSISPQKLNSSTIQSSKNNFRDTPESPLNFRETSDFGLPSQSLSMSGMQHFIQTHGSASPNKIVINNTTIPKSPQNQTQLPSTMRSISNEDSVSQFGNSSNRKSSRSPPDVNNYVEQSINQVFPQQVRKQNRQAQQQINLNQQFFLQQQEFRTPNRNNASNQSFANDYEQPARRSKNNFQKTIRNLDDIDIQHFG